MLIALLSLMNAYITPALYFYILYSTISQIVDWDWVQIVAKIVSIFYLLLYMVNVAGGLTGNNWTKHAHGISVMLSVYTFALFFLVSYNIAFVYLGVGTTGIDYSNFNQVSVMAMIACNLGLFFIIVFMHLFTHPTFVFRLIQDQISYMAFQGAYSQTMVCHAFTNVDDVSWGTKGSSANTG